MGDLNCCIALSGMQDKHLCAFLLSSVILLLGLTIAKCFLQFPPFFCNDCF